MVEEKILNHENTKDETRWNRLVPKKVNIFVWRAIKGKLPVRVELDKRGIDLDTILCPCCGDMVESCDHSLILCNMAMSVWENIFSWWKLGMVDAFTVRDMFLHGGGANLHNYSRILWQVVTWSAGLEYGYIVPYYLFSALDTSNVKTLLGHNVKPSAITDVLVNACLIFTSTSSDAEGSARSDKMDE
ncbi:RNA-directed DNA polymerase, eukaryota, reverse transcriptase zinc-binding domain protein [Tanacetum coccineum]